MTDITAVSTYGNLTDLENIEPSELMALYGYISIEGLDNISLYLGRRKGFDSNYKLVLTLYDSGVSDRITPNLLPIARATRSVSDIDSDNWYVFNFTTPVVLAPGYYSMVLTQENNDESDPVDFNANFCEWLHSSDLTTGKANWSFSSSSGFEPDLDSDFGYGYGYGNEEGIVHGYGYGYGANEAFDYFDVLFANGSTVGEADSLTGYGYGLGYESIVYNIDNSVSRCFKIYDSFNDITYISSGEYIQVKIPPAASSTASVLNRQEFLDATKVGVDVIGNFLTLSESGGRAYSADCSVFDSSSESIKWYESNFFLSNNDVNSGDIINPTGNTNQFRTWLIASPYYSGIYFSTDGGSVWRDRRDELGFPDGTYRNFSCVKFNYDSTNDYFYAIAFDDTNATERGKVFYAILNVDVVDGNGDITTLNTIEADEVVWIEGGRITDLSGNGLKINSALFVGSSLWVATENDVYISVNYGTWSTWTALASSNLNGVNVNQISASYSQPYAYGYGYGYGSGGDYFDVLGVSGFIEGYGVDYFEAFFFGQYGFGYGYEEVWGRGTVDKIYVATDDGPYVYDSGVPGFWTNLSSDTCYCISVSEDRIYIGTDSGILRSIDSGSTFKGDSATLDDFYPYGLLPRRTTSILYNDRDLSEIYVSQYGGVFISKNDAGNFTYVSEKLKENRVKFLLQNPLNNRIVYAFTETARFLNSAVTFLIDSSGSMEANDPDSVRLSMAKKVMSNIYSNAVATPYFQIVKFGLPESSTSSELGYLSLRNNAGVVDFPGTFVLTATGDKGGFVAADLDDGTVVSTLEGIIDSAVSVSHSRTPLFDSIDVLSRGMNNSGSSWDYNNRYLKYIVEDVSSEYFKNLHKSVIIITDGHDTVSHKTASDLAANFGQMRSEVYIVGVGNNVNYQNLLDIKNTNPFARLHIAPPDERLHRGLNASYGFADLESGSVDYLDIADLILEREKIQTREGTWQKIISYSSRRTLSQCNVIANVPLLTVCKYRIRSSENKKDWSAWTVYLYPNVLNTIDYVGKFFEIQIVLESQTTTYSPEVSQIDLITLTPSESYLLFDSRDSGTERISQITFESLDDVSLGNVTDDEIKLDFGFLQSSSSNYNLSEDVYRGKRNVVGRKEKETLTTEDGYFYFAENGAWPMNSSFNTDSVNIYDSDNKKVDRNIYYVVPNAGMVVFYDTQKIGLEYKTYTLEILYGYQYRVTSKITNYTTTVSNLNFHDIAWIYHTDSNTSVRRPSLPFVLSQISSNIYWGRVVEENYSVGLGLSTEITCQYIEKSSSGFSGDFYFSTEQMVNLQTVSGGSDIWRYYEQNAFLEKFNIINPSGYSYISVYIGDDSNRLSSSKLTVTTLDPGYGKPGIHYGLKINLADNALSQTDTLGVIVGDSSQSVAGSGTKGIPTWLKQSNLLFSPGDTSYGEMETSLIFGVSSTDYRPLEPTIKLCGKNATKLVVITPTTVKPSSIFSFSVLAVDNNGLIDRDYIGEVSVSFSPDNFGTLNTQTIYFEAYDEGSKVLSGFSGQAVSDPGYVEVEIVSNGKTFKSNPIIITNSIQIKWGDLNVSTLFSDGRQNIDFISNYAKKISRLDFICINDDLTELSSHTDGDSEWKYIVSKCDEFSVNGLDIFPGLRHRSSLLFGERLLLFDDFNSIPELLITDTNVNAGNWVNQMNTLIDDLEGYSYISIPVRSAYEPVLPGETDVHWLLNRGFDFNMYKYLVQFITSGDELAYSNEPLMEIYSEHGFCEVTSHSYFSNPINFSSNKNQYAQHALYIGKKFGFVASSGGYASRPGYYTGENSPKTGGMSPQIQTEDGDLISNRGVTALLVENSSRSSIVDALKNRSCYATTGAKIYLNVTATYGSESGSMGETLGVLEKNTNNKPTESIIINIDTIADRSNIRETVIFRATIDEKEFFPVYRVLGGTTGRETISFEDTEMADTVIYDASGKEICYYVRVEQDNGHFAWASPIWFNFGRDQVILPTESESSSSIEGVLFSDSSKKVLKGTVSSTDSQNSPLSEFSEDFPMPGTQQTLFTGDTETTTNYTVRQTYSNASLAISDKIPEIFGMRMLVNEVVNEEVNVIYGTGGVRFLYDSDDLLNYSLTYSNESNDLNGSRYVNTETSPPKYLKYSKDWGPYIDSDSVGFFTLGRNRLFGFMWQYSNVSSIENGYAFDIVDSNTDKILIQNGSNIPLVRDPYMFYEGSGKYGVVYVGYESSTYPEKDGSLTTVGPSDDLGPPIEKVYDPVTTPFPDFGDWGRVEDFAGLLDIDLWNTTDRHRIYYTNTTGQTEKRVFNTTGALSVPRVFGSESRSIIYPSCPNYVEGTSDKRIYYLGWFLDVNNNKPVMGLFVNRFSDFTSSSFSTSTNTLCFVFSDEGGPSGYKTRPTSFRTEDFIWDSYKESTITNIVDSKALVGWPRDGDENYPHPAFSIGFAWLNVTKLSNGKYYAFVNKRSTRDSNGDFVGSEGEGGTAVLYSSDGINFYEYDATENLRIPDVKKTNGNPVYYCHSFKYKSKYYMSYRDPEDWIWNINGFSKVKYSAFTWKSVENFVPR